MIYYRVDSLKVSTIVTWYDEIGFNDHSALYTSRNKIIIKWLPIKLLFHRISSSIDRTYQEWSSGRYVSIFHVTSKRKQKNCHKNRRFWKYFHFELIKRFGDAGYRSRYLSHAKRALYHLSYTPVMADAVLCIYICNIPRSNFTNALFFVQIVSDLKTFLEKNDIFTMSYIQ